MMNPVDNAVNIDTNYLDELRNLPEKQRRRFFDGQFASADDTALWTVELLEQCRIDGKMPDLKRIVISVDPSGCSGDEDTRSDEVGIVVVGLGEDGKAYVLEDLSGRMSPGQWGQKIAQAYDRHAADCVIAETNFGGAMVGAIVKAARPGTPFREVHASRGKHVRAEPVAELYQMGKVIHAGEFMDLEDQMCAMTTAGYAGSKSPDRADALVWAITELFPGVIRRPVNSNLPTRASQGSSPQRKGRRH
jgi:predicted phage terminase large subunit-like protein